MRGKEELHKRRRKTSWIGARLAQFSDEVDEVAEMGMKKSVSEWIKGLVLNLHEFGDDVVESAKLASRADEGCLPSINEAEARVGKVRRELAQALSVPSGSVLQEEGDHPGDALTSARALLAEGFVFLDSFRTGRRGGCLLGSSGRASGFG